MIPNSRERDFQAKLEDATIEGKFSKEPSSSRQWSAFRNPRIVRVSRSFGGKDRHSKVCTVRGLRDRRIRLSVPTAIQLYDLQDRLGLSQPSKVVDWLLDATKHEIDKLPPLQIPQGNLGQFHQSMLVSHELGAGQSSAVPFFDATPTFLKEAGSHSLSAIKEGIKINNNVDEEDQTIISRPKYWDNDALRAKSKEVVREAISDKTKWFRINEQENQDGIGGYSSQVSAQNLFPMTNHSSLPGLLNNSMPYNSFGHWEPSSLSLSQFGSHGFPSQSEVSHNNVAVPLPSPLALSSGSQLFFCPNATTPPLFPPYSSYITTQVESSPRHFNHLQLLSSSSQHMQPNSLMPSLHSVSAQMKSFPLNGNSRLFHSQNNDGSHPNKSS